MGALGAARQEPEKEAGATRGPSDAKAEAEAKAKRQKVKGQCARSEEGGSAAEADAQTQVLDEIYLSCHRVIRSFILSCVECRHYENDPCNFRGSPIVIFSQRSSFC